MSENSLALDDKESSNIRKPRRKRERQQSNSSQEPSSPLPQINECECNAALNEINAKLDKLLPLVSQIVQLQAKVEELFKEKIELTKAVEFNNAEIETLKSDVQNLKEQHQNLNNHTRALERTISYTQEQIDKQTARNIKLEAYTRRSNLMLFGVKENQQQARQENTLEALKETLVEELKIPKEKVDSFRFERVHRIPSRPNTNTDHRRPIIARFSFFQEKKEVFQYVKNIHHSSGISIADDFPREIIEIRKKLWPVLKAAKKEKKVAYFKVDRLIIDGCTYYGEETDDLQFYANIM
ncbi:hypothetical protein QZH41_004587 [Actinostola sp. cb2023]|nr:hypothetical protein QZH41_004587 [Actinostola sp. cb2023]